MANAEVVVSSSQEISQSLREQASQSHKEFGKTFGPANATTRRGEARNSNRSAHSTTLSFSWGCGRCGRDVPPALAMT